MYTCLRCGYETTNKTNFVNHFKRKTVCSPDLYDVEPEEFLRMLKLKNDEYKNELIKLQTALLKANRNTSGTINTRNNINGPSGTINDNSTNNNYNINIQINSYDKTDYSVIKDKIKTCILKDGTIDEVKLVELLHFNKDHPENHNIRLENTKTNKILTYDGEKFVSSKYVGKENLWNFAKDTFDKTSEEKFINEEGQDDTYVAVENTKLKHDTIKRPEKLNKANALKSVLENA